jgi:uncharacterized protein (DUF924 family)
MEMQDVLEFWFPSTAGRDLPTRREYWMWRMRGGADASIVERFTGTTVRGVSGMLEHWAETPRGRLALIVVVDPW